MFYDVNQNQRSYSWRRHQHLFQITEYSNKMDSMRLSVTQLSLEVLAHCWSVLGC